MPRTLWERGRLALIFEPCDFWIGGFWDRRRRTLYLIAVPMLPLRVKFPVPMARRRFPLQDVGRS
jgi:hypothetical protein